MDNKKRIFKRIAFIIAINLISVSVIFYIIAVASSKFFTNFDNEMQFILNKYQFIISFIIFSESILFFAITPYYLLRFFKYLSTKSFMSTKFTIQLVFLIILICFLIFEIYYLYHSEWTGVLGVYKKMFPVLFSGFIIGFLYLITINFLALHQVKYFNIYLVLMLLLILLTPLTADYVLLSELKSNIINIFDNFPIISGIILEMHILIIFFYIFMLILPIFFIYILFNFIKAIIKKETKINIKEDIVNLISTLIVTGFYIYMTPMWVKFIAD